MPQPQTLLALVAETLSGPDRDTLAERDANGAWAFTRSQRLSERIAAVAAGLHAAGIAPGERVALMAPNSVDWIVVNLGILHAGAVAVPLYATQAYDQVRHILADSEARCLFVDTVETAAALQARGVILPRTIALAQTAGDDLQALEAAGRVAATGEPGMLAAIASSIGPDDLAVLIYTSGTTGTPKGVMLSQRNIASNAIDAFACITPISNPGDAALSILPFAHIYESTNLYGYLRCGFVIYVNTRIEGLVDDLRSVRPAILLAVPRVFERVLGGIAAQAKSRGGLLALLVPWALGEGREFMRLRAAGRSPSPFGRLRYRLAHRAILHRIKPRLGLERLRCCGSGSAPLHADTALTYLGFDVAISEGYGLTECSPVVTVNPPLRPQIGTVGAAIANVELKIADDGELLVRGPGVMQGYYRDEQATARSIVDGWLHTGDIASIQEDGHVRIVDRKNELFKTSGGKYIAPARVESALLRSQYFNQVMVLGRGRAHPVALVAPNWLAIRTDMHLAAEVTVDVLRERDDVRRFIESEARTQTADLASFEQVRSVGILPRDLTIADGELSPTLKVKRRTVEARYAGFVERPVPVLTTHA